MAKFTILKPPSGHSLRIPTVAEIEINLTFPLQDVQYIIEECSLKAVLPDNTVLIFDKLLNVAHERELAPKIAQPNAEIINTHDLLLSLGISQQQWQRQPQHAQNANKPLMNNSTINDLLASSLHMEQGWQKDAQDNAITSWSNFSYILPAPANKLPTRYHARLSRMPRTVAGGDVLSLGLDFIDLHQQNQALDCLPQPVMLYLVFTPGTENYNIYDFIDWDSISLSGGSIISKDWDYNQQGSCLLKLMISASNIPLDAEGVPRLWLNLPIYDTYIKGMTCSITLAVAISHKMREGGILGGQINIEPNYQARVLYASPHSAEAFSFGIRSLDMTPPNVVLRALNFDQGDFVLIPQLLEALGPKTSYQIKPQGRNILVLITAETKIYRILLENVHLEDMLRNGSFIAIDAAPPDWLTYIYISEDYMRRNAIAEADTVLTVKTLLNAFLEEEDYLSMQTVLDNLGKEEK